MADRLYELLEYALIGNSLYRATDMTHEVVDGVLHFMLQFNYHVLREVEEIPKMQTLKREVIKKNG